MKETIILIVKIAGMTLLIAWLFYDSPIGILCGGVIGPLLVREHRIARRQERLFALEKQFCEGLIFAAGALEAGYSMENAWRQTQQEITDLHGENGLFAEKLREMNQGVSVNQPLEKVIMEFARQTESDNIKNFAEVFYFVRRSGGNLTMIMRRTADRIKHNFQVQEEVQLAISSRKLELLIMNILPFGILGYLKLGSPAFMEPLYHNLIGVGVMTLCLALYFVSWILAKKIIQIGV